MRNANDTISARLTIFGTAMVLALSVAGCRVHVDKDANGKEKNVQVDTPFGGVHVNTDQTSASDLGLPVYPGAEVDKDDDNHKSADVHLGFGEWQLRVKAVSYTTKDDRDKVAAFYKKALARFGDVITCDGDTAVGTPTVTHEGLTCEDKSNQNNNVNLGDNVKVGNHDMRHDYQLKAGSKRHQHIVGFEDDKGSDDKKSSRTRFELVALDLPAGLNSDDKDKQ
jgi:hypothetical protein